MKILMIDDEEISLFLNRKMLELYWSDCTIASSTKAKEVLNDFINEESFPDLILLDLRMPEMDGHEFLERLPTEFYEKLKIIVLSSSLDKDDREKSLLYGCVVDFVNKPLDPTKIEHMKHYFI